jgi:hypothetical protein
LPDCQHKQEPQQPRCSLLCTGCGFVAAADNSGTRLRGRLLTMMQLRIRCQRARRRRGGDPLSSKLWSYNDNKDNDNNNDDKDAVIASTSKNDDDHDIVFFAVIGKAAERQQP